MAQNNLKNIEAASSPVESAPRENANVSVKLQDLVSEVVSLAHETRIVEVANDATSFIPNVADVLRISGRWLLIGDMIALFAGFLYGGVIAWAFNVYVLHSTFQSLVDADSLRRVGIFFGLGIAAILWLDMKGHYRQRLPFWETISHILAVSVVGFIAAGFIEYVEKDSTSRLWLGLSWSFFAGLLLVLRSGVRRRLKENGQWQIPALVIGRGATAKAAIEALNRESYMGFTIIEQIAPEMLGTLTKPRAWKRLMMARGARHLFLALEGSEIESNQAAIKSLVRDRLPCSIVPPWLGLPSSTLSAHHFMMNDVMLLHDTNRLTLPLPRFLKRSFDIIVAGAGLLAVLPLFLVIAIKVRGDGGPAFFTQQRVGKNGKLFACYKFRSMRVNAEALLKLHLAQNPEAGVEWQKFQKLKEDVRITKFGAFIRRTSLDELPQLLNVLKGDMSLVGPRPIMPGQEHYYGDDFTYYEAVRPGITGPWQVSGRNQLTFNERVNLESWYARNWSLWVDVIIILKTIPVLLKKDQAF